MMKLKVCVAGVTGWVGKPLCLAAGARDERLTIRHDAASEAEPYIQGTLLAIRKVIDRVGLIRGLDKIME